MAASAERRVQVIFGPEPDEERDGPVIPPWVAASADCSGNYGRRDTMWWEVEDTERRTVPDVDGVRESFPNSVTVETPVRDNDRDIALDFIAISLAQHLHELLEWVQVDGKRIALPHPENSMVTDLIPDRDANGKIDAWGYWDWSITKMRSVVNAYCRRYPPSKEDTLHDR